MVNRSRWKEIGGITLVRLTYQHLELIVLISFKFHHTYISRARSSTHYFRVNSDTFHSMRYVP